MFITSLYKINYILKDQMAIKLAKDEEDISKVAAYSNYLDVFLKVALDILLLHRLYDY